MSDSNHNPPQRPDDEPTRPLPSVLRERGPEADFARIMFRRFGWEDLACTQPWVTPKGVVSASVELTPGTRATPFDEVDDTEPMHPDEFTAFTRMKEMALEDTDEFRVADLLHDHMRAAAPTEPELKPVFKRRARAVPARRDSDEYPAM